LENLLIYDSDAVVDSRAQSSITSESTRPKTLCHHNAQKLLQKKAFGAFKATASQNITEWGSVGGLRLPCVHDFKS
jgi:hypothetical protein